MFSEDIQNKINKNYVPYTVKCVYSRIKRVFKLMNIKDYDLSKLVINNGDDLINAINQVTITVKPVLLYQVIKLLEIANIECPRKVIEAAKKFRVDANKEIYKQKKDSDLVNPEFNIQNIYNFFYDELFKETKIYSKIKKDNNGEPLELKTLYLKPTRTKYLRLVLFTLLKRRACRLSEFVNMKYSDDGQNNFIDLKEYYIMVRKQKSSNLTKKASTRKLLLSSNECIMLNKCKEYLNSNFVLPNKHNKPLCLNDIEALYRKSILKFCKVKNIEYKRGKMGIHMLRAIEATEDIKDKINLTCKMDDLERIIKHAYERNHSLETMLKYYILNQ
jgi:hypothetical protein